MALERNVAEGKFFQGEDKTFTFEILDTVVLDTATLDSDGNPAITSATAVDVTGWALSWILRIGQNTADPALLTKTVGSGIAITGVYNSVRATNTQRVVVTLDDLDTYDDTVSPTVELTAPKDYAYSLKRTDAGSETVLVWGVLPLGKVTNRA
jgi:hypothetical protein